MAERDKPEVDEALIDLIDQTEIVSVVQRPDEGLWVDTGDTDPDVAISMLAKGFVQLVLDELCADEWEEPDEDSEPTP